jgi:Domain of unknown function (DUF3516)
MFRWVELLSRRRYEELAGRDASGASSIETIAALMAPYWDSHESIGIDGAARSPELISISEGHGTWTVRQALDDPENERDWGIHASVDLAASDEEARPVVTLVGIDDAVGP